MGNSILFFTGAAFLGGVILNVMPCVLPVLGLKVYHLIKINDQPNSVKRNHGLAYTLGILVMFWVLAGVVIALRAAGDKLGWGMQFQNPAFVSVMIVLMVGFGLWALGVFDVTFGMGEVNAGEGYVGSFVKGILASIMSTPCSAPFLGFAATFALGAGAVWWQTLLMFTFIGAGLAFPFLLISYIPALANRLPRPGPWMETVKQLMGFTLIAAAIWLFGALQMQITASGVQLFLGFLLVLSMALWAMKQFGGPEHSTLRRRLVHLMGLALTAVSAYWLIDLAPKEKAPVATADESHPAVVDGKINWAPFDPKMVDASLKGGRPVFMDYTADWCANCKTNEKLFIEVDQIRKDLQATSILPMKADYTTEDETIEAWMDKLGRTGIPIYVIYYPDGSHDLLPEVITTQMLSDALRRASAKYPVNGDKPAVKTASAAEQEM